MSTSKSFFKAPRYLFRKYNILREIKKLPIESFADVGCGAGELACTLAARGYKGIGVDFSEDALRVAHSIKKERGIKSVEFKKGGAEKLARHDIVICCEVLEHIKDDSGFLKSLLPHGSYFIISVPARMKYWDKFDESAGHFRRYEKDDLTKLLQGNSLEIISFKNYGVPFVNITWHLRKLFSKKIISKDSRKDSTKRSGIGLMNTKKLARFNLEPFINFLAFFTLPFNRYNVSEGYLVVCRKVK